MFTDLSSDLRKLKVASYQVIVFTVAELQQILINQLITSPPLHKVDHYKSACNMHTWL